MAKARAVRKFARTVRALGRKAKLALARDFLERKLQKEVDEEKTQEG